MGSTNGRNSRCESNRVRMYAKRFSGSPLSASGACANSHNAAEHSRMCSSNSPIRIRSEECGPEGDHDPGYHTHLACGRARPPDRELFLAGVLACRGGTQKESLSRRDAETSTPQACATQHKY